MSRAGMEYLIARVRSLTGAGTAAYAVGTANYWDADQVQDVLDRHSMNLDHAPMEPVPTYTAGSVTYTRYQAPFGDIEGGSALTVTDDAGNAFGTATWTCDYQSGEFTFTSDQGGAGRYLTTRTYDVHAAGGELLDMWAAHEALAFDFSADGQSYSRSQKAVALRDQARALRRLARIKTKRLRTGD